MPFSFDDPLILREIIMDHYKNPRNYQENIDPSYKMIHMDSSSCIDDIYFAVLLKGDKIIDCKWHGKGCAISMSSTSILSEMVIDHTLEECYQMIDEFSKMLDEKDFDHDLLKEACAFQNVPRQPARITCANISWRGLKKILDKEKEDGR